MDNTNKNRRKIRHYNIPIFIPHKGCPNDCVFCNQRRISGKITFIRESVEEEIAKAIATLPPGEKDVQIAYFGGSFTGIDRNDLIYLLSTAKAFIDRGEASSVRLSTRPDYIDGEILDILENYGVKSIELGVQSMSDKVLSVCRRGHTSADTVRAFRLIKERGFELVGQMMIGLPGSTVEDEIMTAEAIADHGCTGARIYPTVVFNDTELAGMARSGKYAPLTVNEAVERSAAVFSLFAERKVNVIRIGLQANEALVSGEGVYAGAFHPAFGELVMNRFYLDRLRAELSRLGLPGSEKRDIVIACANGETSKIIGQKKSNIRITEDEYNVKIRKVIEKYYIIIYNILITFQ
ncbi:MAG: radical SAM protein [Clostridia bacterium]|nr:radical SAM protein [Clostridia bacterium]